MTVLVGQVPVEQAPRRPHEHPGAAARGRGRFARGGVACALAMTAAVFVAVPAAPVPAAPTDGTAAVVLEQNHDPGSAHDGHHHDAHHVEIGQAPPPGTTREAFESPAWFQTDLAVWSAAVFLGLLAILSKFAWKPIMEGLAKREQKIADSIAATQAANEEARRLLASYERRLAEASDEVRGMLEEARRDSEATRQTIIADARKAAEEEQARARREIGLATDDALSKIAERAGELAVGVAGKFLRDKLGADDQARLVRDSISSITTSPSVN